MSTPALFTETLRRTYVAQRGVSQGAAVTLTASSGGYTARFECAKRCKEVLGSRTYWDFSHMTVPNIVIPTEHLHKSITKLAETFSVALVDTVTDESGTRFVLIWRINPTRNFVASDYTEVVLANQGSSDPLDEY